MDHAVTGDGVTVWVNGAHGACIGRFGRMGIDVHRDPDDQLESGQQCLECTHGPTGRPEWDLFKAAMLRHHGIAIADRHMPRRLAANDGDAVCR